MHYFRNRRLIKTTLFFFVSMLLYQPAFAGQSFVAKPQNSNQLTRTGLPIAYVSEEQARQLAQEFQRKGFTIKQGSLAQLNQILLAENDQSQNNPETRQTKTDKVKNQEKDQDCLKDKESKQTSARRSEADSDSDNKQRNKHKTTTAKSQDCKKGKKPAGKTQATAKEADSPDEQEPASDKPMPVTMPRPVPPPKPETKPEPEPAPQTTVQPGIGVDVDILHDSGGGSGDSAKIFFIITGIFVVAAFIVYTGKYIVDIVQGKHHDLWWEVFFNSTIMDTKVGQHGHFNAAKIATGFVSSDLIQVALVGEVGNADLNLVFNENTTPVILDFTASYWMLGATARLHLSNSLVNASYLYLDFMGGKTNHSETDTIGAARFGASFGINNHLRLGISLGAQYIGLNNNQGFVSNSDKYWYTYGVEMGVQF